jgi:hypothetical protein
MGVSALWRIYKDDLVLHTRLGAAHKEQYAFIATRDNT